MNSIVKQIVFLGIALLCIQASCQQGNPSTKEGHSVTSITTKNAGVVTIDEYIKSNGLEEYNYVILAGGCFWCTEAVFHRIQGVVDVVSGYCGGGTEIKPSYELTGTGRTTFAESIAVFYTSDLDYNTILEVFFVAHDPTTLDRQGPDVGPEYRSAIFYQSEEQKASSQAAIRKVNESKLYDDPIVTTLEPYDVFWTAEDYHQNYYELHPEHGYVLRVSRPKVEKVKKVFADLLKPEFRD